MSLINYLDLSIVGSHLNLILRFIIPEVENYAKTLQTGIAY